LKKRLSGFLKKYFFIQITFSLALHPFIEKAFIRFFKKVFFYSR